METGFVFLVSIHPEVVRVAAKLITGSVETVVKAEVLWRKEASFGSGNVMTRDGEVNVGAVFTDESPSYQTISDHGSGSVDSLNFADGAFVIFDKIPSIWGDGKSTTSVENNVHNFVIGASR